MKTAGKAGRPREGSVLKRKDGSIWARITYFDTVAQKRKDKLRRAENRSHAKELIKEMHREFDDHGAEAFDVKKVTFADLAKHYEEHYLVAAEYDKKTGTKTAGLRSLAAPKGFLKTLSAHFGKRLLRSITYGDIRTFRNNRLKTPTLREKDENGKPVGQRSIASVNRELALLRSMLNVAQQEKWIDRNPMHNGKSLVSITEEHKRERVLTYEEEECLLAVCGARTIVCTRNGKEHKQNDSGKKRKHLRAIIIAAIETGMRKGELLKLKWRDVDFENCVINVLASNTKTMKAREVGLNDRLTSELKQLFEQSPQDLDALVFGLSDVKKSFESARDAAGLSDVRFHDLRHTHATRLIAANIPVAEVARTLGHQQLSTTYRYTNQTRESTKRIADALDAMRAAAMQEAQQQEENSLVN